VGGSSQQLASHHICDELTEIDSPRRVQQVHELPSGERREEHGEARIPVENAFVAKQVGNEGVAFKERVAARFEDLIDRCHLKGLEVAAHLGRNERVGLSESFDFRSGAEVVRNTFDFTGTGSAAVVKDKRH
jgi:hypothetical protein